MVQRLAPLVKHSENQAVCSSVSIAMGSLTVPSECLRDGARPSRRSGEKGMRCERPLSGGKSAAALATVSGGQLPSPPLFRPDREGDAEAATREPGDYHHNEIQPRRGASEGGGAVSDSLRRDRCEIRHCLA